MKKIVDRILSPVRYFIDDSRTAGICIMICSVISISLANSRVGANYVRFWKNGFAFTEGFHLSL